ncbi:MAG TPA: transglutaminase domain-containing protein, partial [Clostridia bacterium]|nr:transglutaminase domain-containing protein [Clostridia bacterium]
MTIDLDFLACPLPEDIQRLKDYGDFDRAKAVIALRMANPKVPDLVKRRLAYELRILDELPRSYPHSEA